MSIDVTDLQGIIKLDKKKIKAAAARVLKFLGEADAELSLLLVDDDYIRLLNHKYLDIDSRTDVLAFSMREGEGVPMDSLILGDVVISVETAMREARKRKIPIMKELYLYLAHGILHLLGYDDGNPPDKDKMKAKEIQLLEVM
ncbi:MAG: rRNA maturation RNase YbeY [Candidatus Omnitrophica bacterium]|nr:rRNA maturation RNase YbeY [Candidatus Omnitrophota bacterium]